MNAYELTKDRADILADELLAYHNKGVCGRAAKMLRQQADRIAELEKQSEPVVYWDGKHFASKEKSSLADIPLYTTPQTKPLSDEEIEEIINKHWNREYGNRNMLTLCRAIEAKVRGQ